MALFQERHRFRAPRFQLSGSPFGSPVRYYATARRIYPSFMPYSITNAFKDKGAKEVGPRTTVLLSSCPVVLWFRESLWRDDARSHELSGCRGPSSDHSQR